MSTPATPAAAASHPPRRGRPRSERAERAVLEAAGRLLRARGLAGLTMDAVALEAGVSKATLYKWWPSKGALALDVLLRGAAEGLPVPDTGDLEADLVGHIGALVRYLRDSPAGRAIAELLGEGQRDPQTAELFRTRWLAPRRRAATSRLEVAARRGEIRTGPDVDVVLDMLYGPVYYRLLSGHATLDDALAADVVELALHGVQPPAR